MAKKLITQYSFTPGAANVGTVRFPGKYALENILLITNTTDNVILYNFADTAFATTTTIYTLGNLASIFPTISQRTDAGYENL